VAAKAWFSTKTALSKLGLRYHRQYIRKLDEQFGNRFIRKSAPTILPLFNGGDRAKDSPDGR
jgi:hypothetical protein